jgi:PAT family beta-lactamase induction signal transducer AmpG
MSVVGKFISGWSGVVVEAWGYPTFFVYAACTGIPAILLVLIVMRHDDGRLPAPPVAETDRDAA